jgi:hypothetical protein
MRHVIGVAGTAKNTGKTTTLQAVAGYLRAREVPVFLTSIGYDGEDLDNITGLPKPKISVEEGDRVASALPLIEGASARFSDLVFAGVKCALGPVYFATAVSSGKVVLAGPASTRDVAAILDAVPGDRVVLLDGALSRLAPMSLATSIVMATGAARNEDPAFLAKELSGIASVMSLAGAGEGMTTAIRVPGGLFAEGSEKALPAVFAHQETAGGSGPRGPRVRVAIDGPVNPQLLRRVISSVKHLNVRASFVANHPVDLLLSGDHTIWPAVLAEASADGHAVYVRSPASLLGFTVNPYVPRFDPQMGGYTANVLPASPFLDAVRLGVSVPCTDIVFEGPGVLESWLRPLLFAPASVNV